MSQILKNKIAVKNYAPNLGAVIKGIDLSKEIDVDFTKILSKYGKRSVFDYKDNTKEDTDASIYKGSFGYNAGTGIIDVKNDFLSDENTIYTSVYILVRCFLPPSVLELYVYYESVL